MARAFIFVGRMLMISATTRAWRSMIFIEHGSRARLHGFARSGCDNTMLSPGQVRVVFLRARRSCRHAPFVTEFFSYRTTSIDLKIVMFRGLRLMPFTLSRKRYWFVR